MVLAPASGAVLPGQERNASVQGQLGLTFGTRAREWRVNCAGMCQICSASLKH